MSASDRWDVFCRVVDNYGDIGIGWRLSRQFVEAGLRVRLVVDDLGTFARIESRIDPRASSQVVAGVEVLRWPDDDAAYEPADVVVELLGCGLPAPVLAAMAGAVRKPAWIDFEYLSAESWVDRFHGMPSPHPSLPLVKHFYYPGFGRDTGGLPIEATFDARRRAFIEDAGAVRTFRRRLGVTDGRTRLLSLFAYPRAPVAGLFEALATDGDWTVVVPDGILAEALGDGRERGAPSPQVLSIPFLDQDDYDRLLWTCDVNCVRGEDSFVRAQLAGRPFVWHIYPQADDAHRRKLAAFQDVHAAAFDDPGVARVERDFWDAWNEPQADAREPASRWLAARPAVAEAAGRWRARLVAEVPLVDRLRAFAAARRDG